MKTANILRSVLASCLGTALLLQGVISYADDTEIFFGGSAIDQGIRPNVLFILDDSGSMNWCLDKDSTSCSGKPTRMPTMKETFKTLLSNTSGINVGVMDLNKTSNGSRILSPVQFIDNSINTKLSAPALVDSADDASRIGTSTNIGNGTLVMGYIKNAPNTSGVERSLSSTSDYSNNNAIYYIKSDKTCSAKAAASTTSCEGAKTTLNARGGDGTNRFDGLFLFRNLNIPAGVTIQNATFTVTTISGTTSTNRTFNLSAVNSKTPGAFNDSTSITDTSFSAATAITTNKVGTVEFNVTNLLAGIKNLAPSADPISDVAIRFRSSTSATGTNFNYVVDDSEPTTSIPANSAPKLTITYTNNEDSNRTTGLRFQTVAIPQGATITSARIDFVPAGSDDRPVTFDVTAQNASDAAAFSTGENFTGRSKTSAASWSAPEWRTQNPPVYVEGPDVRGQVQSIVSNSTWCGNNSMAFFLTPTSGTGSRVAYSVDAGSGLQPVLKVNYTGGEDGCLNPILDISLLDPKDDGRQWRYSSNNQRRVAIDNTTLPFESSSSYTSLNLIGARFQKLPVKPDAKVLEASVIVTPNNSGTTAQTKVHFERTSNSRALAGGNDNNDLGSRDKTSGTACTFTSQGAGNPISCNASGIASELQGIFAASNNWADGNALTLLISQTSTSSMELRAYETSPADAIKLRVKLKSGSLGSNSYTVRNYTNDLVQDMSANGNTPIVPTLYDAARYLTQRSDKHSGPFPSPINSACQATYLVLLTDGSANDNTTTAKNGIAGLTGTSCTSVSNDGERCGRELAKWLHTTDQSDFDGTNTITTHTIGFALQANNEAKTFLQELATAGGGTNYAADNASQLASAFNSIIQEALATNTTFVNTSAPVNTFNRQDNKDQLYFALFRPSDTNRWPGNLKRYRLRTEGGVATIVDADNTPAINPTTGFFQSNARSFWTIGERDGDDIAKGGAAQNLPEPASRNLFTYYGNNPAGTAINLNSDAYRLRNENTNLTTAMFGLGSSSADTTLKEQLIQYIRGLDENGTVARKAMGDPIHSSPRLFTYRCKGYNSNGECLTTSGEDNSDQFAVMGTNEGFVHMIDTANGIEKFSFMPEALLPNIKLLRENVKSTSQIPRRYGMDNTVALWINDANGNGVIYGDPTTGNTTTLNTGEFVYAYATMGRGGRNIYALDLTDRDSPKLLWQINGGSGDFKQLGQTWSTPVKTKIKIGGTITDVLIFAGGYDPEQDKLNNGDSVYTADSMGNAIYIVNARTGALIWSASSASGHTRTMSKMQFSMPSSVRVVDIQQENGVLVSDADRLADQFFVGDMGGQVWRFFINNGQSGSALVTPGGTGGDGIFAKLGGTTAADARRFYNEPDVALLNVNGARALTVNIGSGYRGHPLNKTIQDRFYSLRTDQLFYNAAEGTLTEANLYNATDNLVQAGDDGQKGAAAQAFSATRGGWFISLKGSGEKVLSRALTAAGQIFFNTYEPNSATSQCRASIGRNRSYSVRLADATPTSVEVGGFGTYENRYVDSNSQGIAGDPQLYCVGNDCYVLPDVSVPPPKVPTPPLGKTYWLDEDAF